MNYEGSFQDRVYYAARDGMAITLFTLLSDKTEMDRQKILNMVYDEDIQRSTLLIVAARNGHEDVVKMLSKFKPNLEIEGTVKFDGYMIEGASALWCAAGAGRLSIVKVLVKAGADVNHPTKTNSTPVRAACFDGRLDIVKYLVEHDANIHTPNKYNSTCLMIAAYKGHYDVVKFLLEEGADPNVQANCGASALLFAAESGQLDVVKELIKYNAKFLKNDSGMDPLKAAAEKTRADVVDYLMEVIDVTLEQRIEALELLGASFANDKDNYCLLSAYQYLSRSMELRYTNGVLTIKKNILPPISAYQNWIERQNLPELQAIARIPNSLHMESLTIRERILGTNNPEIPHPVIFRGAVFADNAQFDSCIDLWAHALNLRQHNNISVVKDLLRFAQVFSQMLHMGIGVQAVQVIPVLRSGVVELERNKYKITNPNPKDDPALVLEELDANLYTCLYLITILTKITANYSASQKMEVCKLVFALNQLNLILRDGQTLLHICCSYDTLVDDFHTNDVCKFPCAEAVDLLIKCGADVNAMDNDRNTPLHIIAQHNRVIVDFPTVFAIVVRLIEAGSHVDTVNLYGRTPLDLASSVVSGLILKTQSKLCLKCICANAIKKEKISYKGIVPKVLEDFIELHGPGYIIK